MITNIVRRLTRRLNPTVNRNGGQKDAAWYDAHIRKNEAVLRRSYQNSHYYFMLSIIVERARRDGSRRVLEIGCGPGRLCSYLKDQIPHLEYVGLDFSAHSIEIARSVVPDVRFVVDDARTSSLYTEVDYDLLICTEVLEHVEEDLRIVSNFRPGRRCIGSVPNFPFESHVRHFRDAAQVIDRYGLFFQDLDVMTLKSPGAPDDRFFLFDGVRNDRRV